MTVRSSPGLAAALAAFSLWGGRTLADGPERPRDPWVFRSVLDGRARMLTCALNPKLFVAYDTQTASLRRAWAGEVFFTGGVYDARHGPQPKSVGPAYFTDASDASAWSIEGGGGGTQTPHYLGYRVGKDDVTIDYAFDVAGGRATVAESPECKIDGGHVTLVRVFTVKGLPKDTTLKLNVRGDEKSPPTKHQMSVVRDDGTDSPASTIEGTQSVGFSANGTFRLKTTWSTQ